LLILGAIILGLPLAGIASIFLIHILVGIGLTVVGIFISRSIYKFFKSTLAATIETIEGGIIFSFSSEKPVFFEWDSIDFMGRYTERNGRQALCVYRESDDRLITVPDEYEGFESLVEELEAKGTVEPMEFALGEGPADILRKRFSDPAEADSIGDAPTAPEDDEAAPNP
jgi:hypothetical protein